jgi:hypothetical protein
VAQRRGGFTGKGELTGAKEVQYYHALTIHSLWTHQDTDMPVSRFIASFYDKVVQKNPLYFFKRIEKHFPELFGDLVSRL